MEERRGGWEMSLRWDEEASSTLRYGFSCNSLFLTPISLKFERSTGGEMKKAESVETRTPARLKGLPFP